VAIGELVLLALSVAASTDRRTASRGASLSFMAILRSPLSFTSSGGTDGDDSVEYAYLVEPPHLGLRPIDLANGRQVVRRRMEALVALWRWHVKVVKVCCGGLDRRRDVVETSDGWRPEFFFLESEQRS
jgi:hypothetical protein